jgi:hypothetical protein
MWKRRNNYGYAFSLIWLVDFAIVGLASIVRTAVVQSPSS